MLPRALFLPLVILLHARATGAEPSDDAARLLALVNADRLAVGAPALAWDDGLAEVARRHAADMRERGDASHVGLADGATLADRVFRAGLRVTRVAENVAVAPDAETAHEGFMASPGHAAHVLDGDLRVAGFGVATGARGLFVVQDFAVPAPNWDARRANREILARILPGEGGLAWAAQEDPALSRALDPAVARMVAADAATPGADACPECWVLAYVAADPTALPSERKPPGPAARAGVAAAWARTPTRRLGAWFVAIALAP